jgi:GDPmannose 4,6-dehydratase
MTKTALISGITGQDGSYLSELLLSKGYEVHGLIRRASTFNTDRIDHLYRDPHESSPNPRLHYFDLTSGDQLAGLLYDLKPDEIYHLGAQSHVQVSFQLPEYTTDVVALGTTRMLEAIRRTGVKSRFYQASSSEMFGVAAAPQGEETPFKPRSPYAAAKLHSHWMTVNYRDGYNIHASSGILFNHESPRRGHTFLTRKVTEAVARIKAGRQDDVYLGNLDSLRDWGYAPEYVECMWLILQRDVPDDYVIGTGHAITVQQFVESAFEYAGLDWKDHVRIDERYMRPTDVPHLEADASKAKKLLDWQPRVLAEDLVKIMVDADLELIGETSIGEGKAIVDRTFGGWHTWENSVTMPITRNLTNR